MEELLQKLIEFVESASPQVWGILVKQVYANVVANCIWTGMLSTAGIVFWRVYKHASAEYAKTNDDGWQQAQVFSFLAVAVCAIGASVLIVMTVKMAINPEYYAIQSIINSLRRY